MDDKGKNQGSQSWLELGSRVISVRESALKQFPRIPGLGCVPPGMTMAKIGLAGFCCDVLSGSGMSVEYSVWQFYKSGGCSVFCQPGWLMFQLIFVIQNVGNNTFVNENKISVWKFFSLEKNDLTLLLKRFNIRSFNKTVKEITWN